MLVWIPITVRMIDPRRMLERKTVRDDWLARSMPVINVGSETLNRTLIVAILHHGIERSKGTRLVENSSESMLIGAASGGGQALLLPDRRGSPQLVPGDMVALGMADLPVLKIFLSSPGDVAEERA